MTLRHNSFPASPVNECLSRASSASCLIGGILGIEDTPLYEFVKKVRFDYFHSEADGHAGIRNSSEMPIEDNCLIHYANKTGTMRFSDKSRFVKGCIRISTVK